MKKKYILLSVALLAGLLLSCSGPNRMSFYNVKNNLLTDTKNNSPTKAKIVFLRPEQFGTNKAEVLPVYDNETLVGMLPNKSHFVYETDPGEHLFGGLMGFKMDFLKAYVGGGKTYYVKCIRQDRFIGVYPLLAAIKKDSMIVSDLENIIATSDQTELVDYSNELYKVQNSTSGMYIEYKLYWKHVKVNFSEKRDAWLKKEKDTGKPMLLIEDGI
jgi:hypothetical protein